MLRLPYVSLKPESVCFDALPESLQADAQNSIERLQNAGSEQWFKKQELNKVHWLVAISPFIGRTLMQYRKPAAARLFDPLPFTEGDVSERLKQCSSEDEAMRTLRQIRHIEMARIAAFDLTGDMSVTRVLQQVSDLADMLIEQSLEWLTGFYKERWGEALFENGTPMPLMVLAMGKLGGHELNFSSDIDLIFCYPEKGETQGGKRSLDHEVYFTRIAQGLIKLLGHQTVDGQAYRIDMRLRPFGQSGPMVTSLSALEDYYQEQGRNWERYALVKARVLNAGPVWQTRFYRLMRPFVYRRYLDYSAIDALRKMKLLINQEARRKGVAGNIKLGVGGIREVEFVAQVFQLIRGGREPEFQTRSVIEALSVCEEHRLIDPGAVSELLEGYAWLRKVEHVLQEINDDQTQTLPDDEVNRLRVLQATGYKDWDAFMSALQQQMQNVHQHFLDVIGGEDEMYSPEDSEFALLWQDLLDDETAVDVFDEAGVDNPEACWNAVRNLRQDLRKRSSGPRGREILASLVPYFVESAVQRPGTDVTLERVFDILRQIASRTTYLDLLAQNKDAREQLVFLCQSSPWVAHLVAKFPLLLDELIDANQLYQLPEPDSYRHRVSEYLMRIPNDDAEAQMDALRQVKQIHQLKVAAADLNDGVKLERVSDHLTFLAEAMIDQVVMLAWRQLTDKHGCPPGKSDEDTGFGVLGYGKLGGYELGYGSDLDLVFVCEDDIEGDTDGHRPIAAQQFYIRLAQRILHLFTTRTMSGVLYDVDMRLRPSGQSGLLVIRLGTYAEYLNEDAWTWELQALVRARMVFGTPRLFDAFAGVRRDLLAHKREPEQLVKDVLAMRKRMREHLWKKHAELADVKQMPGGITDIEFISQYLVLRYAPQYPQLSGWTDNIRILDEAEHAGLIDESDVHILVRAYQDYRTELHRLALEEKGNLSDKDYSEQATAVQQVWQRMFGVDCADC